MSKLTIDRKVTVTIERAELLRLFTEALAPEAKQSTGREFVLWQTLSHLIGIPDVKAVRIANGKVRDRGADERITVEEFRLWLPKVFSKFADDVFNKERA